MFHKYFSKLTDRTDHWLPPKGLRFIIHINPNQKPDPHPTRELIQTCCLMYRPRQNIRALAYGVFITSWACIIHIYTYTR